MEIKKDPRDLVQFLLLMSAQRQNVILRAVRGLIHVALAVDFSLWELLDEEEDNVLY